MKRPYAYLRKSRVMRDQEIVSPEMQLAAATEYAATFGDSDLVVLTDLNISGRKGRRQRPGFDSLLTAIEAGECSAVYSYSLSRLSRSVRDMIALADLCRAHNVPIRLARDIDPDPTTATGRAILSILAVIAQLEADLAQERARDAVEARRAKGGVFGSPRFRDTDAVLDAFREAGSARGTARILTARGIPTRYGKAEWDSSSVQVILRRLGAVLPTRAPGAKHSAPFLFYRLLRCHCGRLMTGSRSGSYTRYRCHGLTHAGANVREAIVLEWARREMARMRPPSDLVALADSTSEERLALDARLDRLRVAFLAGLVDEATMRAEKADIDAALTRLDLQGQAVRIPDFSWDHSPRDLNLALRALWEYVELGPDLRPVRAQWLVPESWLA